MVITIQPFLRYLTTNIIKGQKVLAINAFFFPKDLVALHP